MSFYLFSSWCLTRLCLYIYERSTCRYVRLNALNVPHVPRPRFIAPKTFKHCLPIWLEGSLDNIKKHFQQYYYFFPKFKIYFRAALCCSELDRKAKSRTFSLIKRPKTYFLYFFYRSTFKNLTFF